MATGICAMMGAGINVIPFMIQRDVPGIGPHVLLAYCIGVVPALFAAFSYAILSSAMPRAGGSYVYASRSLSPYLGFVASFSQWFGLSMALGVVSYVLVPFLRDIAEALSMSGLAGLMETGALRLLLPIAFLWGFTVVNLLGVQIYQRTLVPLMFLMFIGGLVAIPVGFAHRHEDFVAALKVREGIDYVVVAGKTINWGAVAAASVILFSSFIGFDSVAQAGGEAKNPSRNLPLAIGISIVGLAAYYILFTAAIYHTVPWSFVAEKAQDTDLTVPGLLGYVLSPGWTVVIVAAAAIALANDLPAMILSISRLVFAWSEDGIFPRAFARVSPRFHTPHRAILLSASMATVGILGNHLSGNFFLGVNLLVTAMLVNFLLMALSVLTLRVKNPALADGIHFMRGRSKQLVVGGVGSMLLLILTVIQVVKDVSSEGDWYLHSTYTYLIVLGVASIVFFTSWRRLEAEGVDVRKRFSTLPRD